MSTIYKDAWNSDEGAAEYERNRPGYAEAAIDLLVREFSVGPSSRIVDLGAGTGKLTRQLLSSGAEILAIEPLQGMRAALARAVPQVAILSGSAESTGLDESSIDAILCAQAWHWFDSRRALAEADRILKSGGGIGLLWNEYDRSVPWVDEYAGLRDRCAEAHHSGASSDWTAPFQQANADWLHLQNRTFKHTTSTTRAQAVGRMLSSSVLAVLSIEGKAAAATEIENILDGYPETKGQEFIETPYITDVYWTRKIPESEVPSKRHLSRPISI